MPIILAVTLLQKSKNYDSICIISKLAKDKVSSEGKGLTRKSPLLAVGYYQAHPVAGSSVVL